MPSQGSSAERGSVLSEMQSTQGLCPLYQAALCLIEEVSTESHVQVQSYLCSGSVLYVLQHML